MRVIYTYIIGHYNPSVSLILLMLCALNLYLSGGTNNLTSTPNDRFLINFSMTSYFSQSFCQKYFYHISLCDFIFPFQVRNQPGIRTRALRLISQLTLPTRLQRFQWELCLCEGPPNKFFFCKMLKTTT